MKSQLVKKYERNCPKCKKILCYASCSSFCWATRINSFCKPCSAKVAGVKRRKRPAINRLDLTRQKFGRLSVLESADGKSKGRERLYRCICVCGNIVVISSSSLRSGNTKSCGCLRHERYNWRGCGEISATYWYSQREHAKDRGRKFLITIEEAWALFLKQDGKCAYTGLLLVFEKGKLVKQTASLDRIDSAGDYVLSNLQWVHKEVNLMKHRLSHSRFLELCKLVTESAR